MLKLHLSSESSRSRKTFMEFICFFDEYERSYFLIVKICLLKKKVRNDRDDLAVSITTRHVHIAYGRLNQVIHSVTAWIKEHEPELAN